MPEPEQSRSAAAQESELRDLGIKKLARLLDTYRDPEKLAEAKRASLLDSSPELMAAKAHPDIFDSEIKTRLSSEIRAEIEKPFPEDARGFGPSYQDEVSRRTKLIAPVFLGLTVEQVRQIGLASFECYMKEGKPSVAADVAAVYFLKEKRAEAEAALRGQH